MSCRRAFEIDLPAFVAEPARPEYAEFRAHYPMCGDCAREVATWTELEATRAGVGSAHPEPAALLRFEERAAELAAPDRARIESHLARCASCRDELVSLRAFSVAQPRAAHGREPGVRAPARRSRIARARAVVLHPAFAYAVVALLAWPAAQSLFPPASRDAVLMEQRAEPAASTAGPALREELAKPGEEHLFVDSLEARRRIRTAQRTSEPPARADAPEQVVPGEPAPEAKRDAPAATPAPPAASTVLTAEPTFRASSAEAGAAQEREFSYGLARERRAASPARSTALALDSALASEPVTADRAAWPRLRIELPAELRAERELLVRVHDDAQLRELRERVRPTPGAASIELALPEDWPAGIGLEVELRAASAEGAPERVFRQTLRR